MITSGSLVRCLPAALLLALTAACTREPTEPVQTVEYYREHADERTAMLKRCANDPGRLAQEPNCANAKQAAEIEDVGAFDDLPPMNLQAPQESGTSEGKADQTAVEAD